MKVVEYNIERFNDNHQWIHCCYGGKTKEQALKRLEQIVSYKHHEGYDFRIVRDEYEPDYVGRL